jgi:hypothetical protein
MWIRIAWELYSQSTAGFWKNNRAAVHAIGTVQYNLIQSSVSLEKCEDCIIKFWKFVISWDSEFLS